jgi:general secretion pathway protein H
MGNLGKGSVGADFIVKTLEGTGSQSGSLIAPQSGFTLIEILAVVVIIGFMASMMALSMGGRESENTTVKEMRVFLQAVDFANEYAVLNGEVIGMFAAPKEAESSLVEVWCYRWKRFQQSAWADMPADTMGEHCLPEKMEMELVIEGRVYKHDPDLEVQPPLFVVSPSGETTPIELSIFEQGGGSEPQKVEINMMGVIDWLNQTDEEKLAAEKSEAGSGQTDEP